MPYLKAPFTSFPNRGTVDFAASPYQGRRVAPAGESLRTNLATR